MQMKKLMLIVIATIYRQRERHRETHTGTGTGTGTDTDTDTHKNTHKFTQSIVVFWPLLLEFKTACMHVYKCVHSETQERRRVEKTMTICDTFT